MELSGASQRPVSTRIRPWPTITMSVTITSARRARNLLGARPSNRRHGHYPSNEWLMEPAKHSVHDALARVRPCGPGSAPTIRVHVRLSAEAIELQDVVRRAHQRPFRLHLREAPQQKGSEAARVLDLPDHG